jgi:hypothetical protein
MAEDQGYAPEQGGSSTEAQDSEQRTVVDAVADLLQTVVDYLRQEAGALVRDKVAAPLQRVGLVIAWASAAASVFVLGVLFVSAGVLLVIAKWLGWPGALFLVGGVLILGFVVFTALKMRSMRDVAADER